MNISPLYKNFVNIIQSIPISRKQYIYYDDIRQIADSEESCYASQAVVSVRIGLDPAMVVGKNVDSIQKIIKSIFAASSIVMLILTAIGLIIERCPIITSVLLTPVFLFIFIIKIIANIRTLTQLSVSKKNARLLGKQIKLSSENSQNTTTSKDDLQLLQKAQKTLSSIIKEKYNIQAFSLFLTLTALCAIIALIVVLACWVSGSAIGSVSVLGSSLGAIEIVAIGAGSALGGSLLISSILKIRTYTQVINKKSSSYRLKTLLKDLANDKKLLETKRNTLPT